MESVCGVSWFGSGRFRKQPVSLGHSFWKQASAAEMPRKNKQGGQEGHSLAHLPGKRLGLLSQGPPTSLNPNVPGAMHTLPPAAQQRCRAHVRAHVAEGQMGFISAWRPLPCSKGTFSPPAPLPPALCSAQGGGAMPWCCLGSLGTPRHPPSATGRGKR